MLNSHFQFNSFRFIFLCNRWLAVDEDDGEIDRFLPVASKKNILSFTNLFSDNTRQKVAEDHLWFSVLFRPQYSNFTRVQRATCCLCLLFLTMIANAMFYGQGGKAAGTASLQIGPLRFNLGMLWISFISILVVTPPILLVVTLFRMSKPKRQSPNRHFASKSNIAESDETIVEVFQPRSPHASCSSDHSKPEGHENENPIEDPKAVMDGRRLDPDQRWRCACSCLSPCCKGNHHKVDIIKHAITFDESTGSRRLPYQCVFVSYVLVAVAVAASGFFLVLYSMQWGKAKSEEWLSAMFLSTFQSLFILDPIKVSHISPLHNARCFCSA